MHVNVCMRVILDFSFPLILADIVSRFVLARTLRHCLYRVLDALFFGTHVCYFRVFVRADIALFGCRMCSIFHVAFHSVVEGNKSATLKSEKMTVLNGQQCGYLLAVF